MREMLLQCPNRGQHVRLAFTDATVHDSQAPIADADLVCLDVDGRCGVCGCPLLHESIEAVDIRLARSGLRPEARRHLLGHCDGCERETELVLTAGGYVTCVECGTTRDWSKAH